MGWDSKTKMEFSRLTYLGWDNGEGVKKFIECDNAIFECPLLVYQGYLITIFQVKFESKSSRFVSSRFTMACNPNRPFNSL